MPIPSHLLPNKLAIRDYATGWYSLFPPPGVTREHVVDPNYWVHIASRLKANDRIEVVAEDGSLDMDLRVIAVDPSVQKLWAQVRVLRSYEAEAVAEKPAVDTGGYRYEWAGPVHRWRVMFGDELVEHGHPDKAAAIDAAARLAEAAEARKRAA